MSKDEPRGLDGLIEALQIFRKYGNPPCPTHCRHDELMVVGPGQNDVSDEDCERLKSLSFEWDSDTECWSSFYYGSA